MSDIKMRERILDILKSSNDKMTADQLADKLEITNKFFVLIHNLNHLTLTGNIVETKKPFGESLFSIAGGNMDAL